MGKPTASAVSTPEFIGCGGNTRGTETSKYPEERKSTETPLVAASERGIAQTGGKQFPPGLWDSDVGFGEVAERSGKVGHRG